MHDSEFHEALRRYVRLRRIAYDRTEHLVDPGGTAGIRLTDIDAVALDGWKRTWKPSQPRGYGGWDWTSLVARVCSRPSAFQVAIWSGERLSGLAAGRPSKRRPSGKRHTISVHFLEGNPHEDHPLRGQVAPIALTAAEVYGSELGATRIRLIDPLPGVFRLYEQLGFSIAGKSNARLYFEKRIERHGSFRL